MKQESNFKESEDEKNTRLGNIYFSQLIHVCYNMISFKIPKDKIKSLILAFSKQNNLPEHLELQLRLMIVESEYEDYEVLDKKEQERLEAEELAKAIYYSEENSKGTFYLEKETDGKNFEIRRSKTLNRNIINNASTTSINDKNDNKIKIEDEYEFISVNELASDLKKQRSQSLYENPNDANKLNDSVIPINKGKEYIFYNTKA